MNTRVARIVTSLGALELSWPAIGLYAIASLVGGFISLSASSLSATRIALSVLVATLLALVIVWGLRDVVMVITRGRPVMRVIGFLIVAVVVGASRGLVLTELSSGVAEISQVTNSIWGAVLWLTLGAALFAGRQRYMRRYRSLLLQAHGVNSTDWDAHPSVQQVKSHVASVADTDAANISDIARVIREEIETNIRPLSHRLWFSADGDVPRARWSHLARDACASFTVPIGTVGALWFLGALLGATRLFGVTEGVLSACVSTALLVGGLLTAKRWLPRSALWGGAAFAVISLVTIYGSDGVLALMGFPSQLLVSPTLLIFLPITICGLLVASSAISLAEVDRSVVLSVAERTLREQSTHISQKRASAFLHNSLQAELTGLALQLEKAAASGSSTEAKEALERVHAMLARSVSEDFREVVEAPEERLHRVVGAWQGLCDVQLHLEQSAVQAPQFPLAVQVAEELIANAVRHGGAKAVGLTFAPYGGHLRVISETDTPISSVATAPGLGSELFAAVSLAGAVVSHEDGRSRVLIDLD